MGSAHLQRVLDAVQAVLRAVGGGVAAPPVEGDTPDLEPGCQATTTDVVVSIHVQRHWGVERIGGGGGGSGGDGREERREKVEEKEEKRGGEEGGEKVRRK